MGIARLLIIVGVIWFAMSLYRRYRLGVKRTSSNYVGKMVQCSVCGVYLPEPEAQIKQPGMFRCPAHRGDDAG